MGAAAPLGRFGFGLSSYPRGAALATTTTAISWTALRGRAGPGEVLDGWPPGPPWADVGLALVDHYLLPYELCSCASSNENGGGTAGVTVPDLPRIRPAP